MNLEPLKEVDLNVQVTARRPGEVREKVNDLPLYGARVPGKRKYEQPWHRAAAMMLAAGRTKGDVAAALDKDQATISLLLRERWFQQNLIEEMRENGGKDIMEMFKSESMNSLLTLIEIRDNAKASPAVRAAAARDILDRHLGKPTQRVETVGEVKSGDPVAEAERLEQENARLSGRFVGIQLES